MNYCQCCGRRLTPLVTAGGWESRYRCDSCGTRFQISFGDGKSSSDVYRVCGNRPFDIEQVKYETPVKLALADDFDFGV